MSHTTILAELDACVAIADDYARDAEEQAKAYRVGPQKPPKSAAEAAREIARLIESRKGAYQ